MKIKKTLNYCIVCGKKDGKLIGYPPNISLYVHQVCFNKICKEHQKKHWK